MILGIGTDIIEVSRVLHSSSREESRKKLFTQNEIAYCSKQDGGQSYAARFAAKEAFFKALGTGWSNNLEWTDVEVLNNESGKPYFVLHGEALSQMKAMGGTAVHLSLSHIKSHAIAYVIIEG
jgi:holo-[acyl-carrier protein] synthase